MKTAYKVILSAMLILSAAEMRCAAVVFDNTLTIGRISDFVYSDSEDAESIIMANRGASKCVALTFDDGPHPIYTSEILDILAEYEAKATFFVIGKNAEEHPELIKREFDEGHEIGNHTYSHPKMKSLRVTDFVDEISKTQKIIADITGSEPRLFRPPGGYLKNDFVEKTKDLHCTSVLWSWRQDTRDWSRPAVDKIVSTVMDNLRDGDIILFHDYNGGKSPTPDALRLLLPKLKELGYSFVTVSELMDDGNIMDS